MLLFAASTNVGYCICKWEIHKRIC